MTKRTDDLSWSTDEFEWLAGSGLPGLGNVGRWVGSGWGVLTIRSG
jgi:hypothetical protein